MEKVHSILIVEDESVVSIDLEMNLQRFGYAIAGNVTSGAEALQVAHAVRPDLVLMDIQLRGAANGLTSAAAIHDQLGIPIVFVTANADEETIARSQQSGSYGFLNKPFRPSELKAAIEIALHQHQASQKLSADKDRLEEEVYLASEALGQTREELQALSRHLMQAQEDERSRIARELHDDLGQRVALLGMLADQLHGEAPANIRERCVALRAGLSELAEGLRQVSHKLHPSIIADLGLTEALNSLVSDFSNQGLLVTASLAQVRDVPIAISTSLYRVAQESLRNALKHAPASIVRVSLTASPHELNLRVSDNGRGFSVGEVRHRGGLGLISMQERARLVGGNLLLTAEPNKGTTVLVRVPLRS